ncbi:NUDIX domain-containing protein [Paenibacillus sp. GCM10023250]|uniref:NUDIX domain-containing protein n=1 Tax=Paenibacillus sp. GCM10023250 TaxID=3252648 RepID=UPI003608B413
MGNKNMGAAAIIADAAGRVLLVQHSYGKLNWDLPGGKSEIGESARETASRETMEETGLDAAVGALTGIYYDPEYDMHHFAFLASNQSDRTPEPASPEILACGYFAPDELPRPMSDFTYRRIQDALAPSREELFHVIGPRVWLGES